MRILAGCLVIAAAITSGCAVSNEAAAVEPVTLPRSGDPDLDELRRIAVNAPVDELTRNRMLILGNVVFDYRSDEYLWRGMARLCDIVLADASLPDRRLFALGLAQAIQGGDQQYAAPLLGKADELNKLR